MAGEIAHSRVLSDARAILGAASLGAAPVLYLASGNAAR